MRVCSNKRGRDSFFEDDFFQEGKDSLNDAKQLFAQGEKLLQKGQFQQGQRLFKQAEQQLRQAKQQTPMQPFKSSNLDFHIPKINMGGADPSWKTSTLAILGVGAVATLVAGGLHALHSPQDDLNRSRNCPLHVPHDMYIVDVSSLCFLCRSHHCNLSCPGCRYWSSAEHICSNHVCSVDHTCSCHIPLTGRALHLSNCADAGKLSSQQNDDE